MNLSNNVLSKITEDGRQPLRLLVVLFALLILAVSITFFALSLGKPHMGATLFNQGQGWVVQSVDASGVAGQAGIRTGDRPIEINGQPAETFLLRYTRTGTVFEHVLKQISVTDERGQVKSAALDNSSPSRQSVTEQITWLLVSVVSWITGFFVLVKRPGNAAALLLCLFSVTVGLALGADMAAVRGIQTAAYFEVSATVIGPWLLLHFFLILPEERIWIRNSHILYLIYLLPVLTVVLFPLVGYADGQAVQWFRAVRFLEDGIGFLAAAAIAVYNYFGSTAMRTRQQMKIVSIGCFAALVPFAVLYLLPEAIWSSPIAPPETSILLIVFIPLTLGYAVVTQKLMDIDVVIRRGIIYGLITLTMTAILSVAIFLATEFQETLDTPKRIFIALALGAAATILFAPVKKAIEYTVDRLLYKDRYDYRQIIQSFSSTLGSLNDLTDISRLTVATSVRALNLAGGCLFIKAQSKSFEISASQGTFSQPDKQERLATLISGHSEQLEFPNPVLPADPGIAFLIPLVATGKKLGMLCLSQKVSRQGFSADDMYLLQGLASVAAMAVHRAILIQDVSIRDTFVSIASHELRTPLTSILGYAELLLRREPPDSARQRWLKSIFDSGLRISAMVDDLLNVSRIQSGKATFKLEPVKLPDVLNETLSLTKESTEKHRFTVDIEPDVPDVVVDRAKFGQVVGNLLSNAVKYSPNGGCITLSAHCDTKKRRVVVSVTDEGIGIAPEDRNSLFTTFHRIQRPETNGVRGSGLGLYIAKEWTEAMGGEIWLESELNKGSTFFVAVPARGGGSKTSLNLST